MASSVDPTVEIAAIKSRLDGLSGECVMGAEQGHEFPLDAFGSIVPYRDFEPGSVIPAATGRMLGAEEQGQPYIFAMQVHHVAPSRAAAVALSIETDTSLIGWTPSDNSGPLAPFYFTVYDETAKAGERVRWIATRFYETTLGQNPDLG